MNKKMIAFAFIAWAIADMASPSPVKALANIPEMGEVTEVVVTGHTKLVNNYTATGCGEDGRGSYEFIFQQLMVVPGVGPVWVDVDFLYSPGPKDAVLIEACENGDNVYGLDSCSC